MSEVVSAYEQDISFITGFAGSGKSTEIAKRAGKTTLVLVPTHKAADVLIGKGLDNVYTIHSVLKLVPTLNQSVRQGQRIQKLKRLGATDLSAITEVIIDEYSLLNTAVLDLLLEVLPDKAKVTVVGDGFQLDVIEGDRIYPEDYTDNILELNIQHRAEAPAVVETFMRFMYYIKEQQ